MQAKRVDRELCTMRYFKYTFTPFQSPSLEYIGCVVAHNVRGKGANYMQCETDIIEHEIVHSMHNKVGRWALPNILPGSLILLN